MIYDIKVSSLRMMEELILYLLCFRIFLLPLIKIVYPTSSMFCRAKLTPLRKSIEYSLNVFMYD